MKKYIMITVLSLIFVNCKSQSQIIDILDYDGKAVIDTYYKDVNNLLDSYTGTWIYDNGTRYIKLVLTKKIKFYNGKIYKDIIVGGVEYKENGTTKVNTLSYLDNNYSDDIKYAISGNYLVPNYGSPKCFDCQPSELRLRLIYHELNPNTSFGTITLRKITVNGQEAIKLKLKAKPVYYTVGETTPDFFQLPSGEYIFIKQ